MRGERDARQTEEDLGEPRGKPDTIWQERTETYRPEAAWPRVQREAAEVKVFALSGWRCEYLRL